MSVLTANMKNKLIVRFSQEYMLKALKFDHFYYFYIFGFFCIYFIITGIQFSVFFLFLAAMKWKKQNQWRIGGFDFMVQQIQYSDEQDYKQLRTLMSQSADKKRNLAQRKVHSAINNSCTKALYSFSRAQRFPNRMYRSVTDMRFYDVNVKQSGKRVSFSSSKRSNLWKDNGVPGPSTYNVADMYSNKKLLIQFKSSREQCKANSVFQPNPNPGPGNYDPKQDQIKYKKVYYSLGKKIQIVDTMGKASPGPVYNIQSTLLDQNKHLSIYVKRNSTKICKPRTCFPLQKREKTEPVKPKESQTSYMTNKGDRQLGKQGPFPIQTRSKRLFQMDSKDFTPGPGHYHSFSEFIDQNVQAI